VFHCGPYEGWEGESGRGKGGGEVPICYQELQILTVLPILFGVRDREGAGGVKWYQRGLYFASNTLGLE